MATYSSAPVESIIRYSYKDSAFSSTSFTKTLVTVGENEQYDLLQMHAFAQDGDCTAFLLYGDYTSIVDDPGNSGQGVNGYWLAAGHDTTNIPAGVTGDNEIVLITQDLSSLDYLESTAAPITDQARIFVNSYGPNLLSWRQGATIKLSYTLDDFTPANEEFFDVDIWLRKTVYNG